MSKKILACYLDSTDKSVLSKYLQPSLDVIIENGVAGLILEKNIANYGILNEETIERLVKFDQQLEIIHLLQENLFKKLFQTLHQSDIDFLILKGWALSYLVYKKQHHRPKTDLDILINSQQVGAILEIFSNLGFYNPRGWIPSQIIDQFTMRYDLAKGITANVDIHLKLTNDKAIQDIFIWENLNNNPIYISDLSSYSPNKTYLILHAIIHFLHHRANGDFLKLIWYKDIEILVESLTPDEESNLLEEINKLQLGFVVSFCIFNISSLLKSKRLNELKEKSILVKSNKKYNYLTSRPSRTKLILRNFTYSKGIKNKFLFLKETLFPHIEEIENKYGKDSRVPKLFLYLMRIIMGIKNNFKR